MIELHNNKRLTLIRRLVLIALLPLALPVAAANTESSGDALATEFKDPPNSARPRVWWHWISGNISKDGIDKDLAWLKSVGIGGIQHFDVGLTERQIVDKRLQYMTPDWKDAFQFAANKAQQLGLEMTIASSPGWSETGGPWVQPANAMKKLVWSETALVGGKRFRGVLAAPPSVTGPYQQLAMTNPKNSYYADIRVLAYPEREASIAAVPHYSVGADSVDAAALIDDDLKSAARIGRPAADQPPTVVISYDKPTTIRAATLFVRDGWHMFTPPIALPRLEVLDKSGWRKLAEMPLAAVPTTVSFAAVTASKFRVVMDADPANNKGRSASAVQLADLRLSPTAKINRFEAKAGFAVAADYYALNSEAETKGISPDKVIDVTQYMQPDGSFDWSPPAGRWRVLRLGYSLLGDTNHPATPDSTGLEVDKYDAAAVRSYMDHYLDMYRNASGPDLFGARGVRALLTDSIEVSAANWTPKMLEQFRRLRGYDATPWLPTLTGVIIQSRAASDAFLYDFRRTLADLMSNEHYDQVARSAHEAGLSVYGESQEGGRVVFGDDMTMRSHADIPMAALWTFSEDAGPAPGALADMRGAASVAHVYGRQFVAAESMTSSMKPWAFAPADLRRIIDLEFANGINRPIIHTSVHQPIDKAPGISLSIFGQYFNRLESWADMARPWIDYIARSSYLLQQGNNVADVAYFSGEEAPLTALHGDEPVHYGYDFINADMLRDVLTVENGDIVAKGGARYRAIYLGGSSEQMTLGALRRLSTLIEQGAIVVGTAPIATPSLADDAAEFRQLVERLWSGGAITNIGLGKVIASRDIEAALTQLGVEADFNYSAATADNKIFFVHRRSVDGDIYFLSNGKNATAQIEARFRVAGKRPEIWRADTGSSESVSYRIEGGKTVVPLAMAAHDSLFVVFRKPAADHAEIANAETVTATTPTRVGEINGPWSVTFQAGRGAPPTLQLPQLASLTDNENSGVKYFSGIATYSNAFSLPRDIKPGAPLWLDLGQVCEIAEIRVNGKLAGTAWKAPYRLDIGPLVKAGRNALEIRVANLWVNRLIGDAQPGAEKIAFTVFPTYAASAPLRPSGLLGPVQLLATPPLH